MKRERDSFLKKVQAGLKAKQASSPSFFETEALIRELEKSRHLFTYHPRIIEEKKPNQVLLGLLDLCKEKKEFKDLLFKALEVRGISLQAHQENVKTLYALTGKGFRLYPIKSLGLVFGADSIRESIKRGARPEQIIMVRDKLMPVLRELFKEAYK